MENVTIANALVPQAKNTATAKAADAAAGGGDVFGALLTQQLQQGQAPDAVAALALGIEGAIPPGMAGAKVAASSVGGAEESVRDALLTQTESLGMDVPKQVKTVGKSSDLAEVDGKKLPLDLPVESKSEPGPPADNAALAAMFAAQVVPQPHQPVAPAGTVKVDPPMAADKRSVMLESVMVRGVSTKEAELHTTVSSDVPVAPQANPQSFSALMADRTAANPGAASMPTLEIPQRVDTAQWGGHLGDKVVWMVGSQTQGAELRLNPPALGPLEVRVSVGGDGQATLSFLTQHAPVREAIEAATPRLREMLAESGISLGSVSVNVGTFAQQQPGQQEQSGQRASVDHWSTSFDDGGDGFAPLAAASARYLRDGGMVDLFA